MNGSTTGPSSAGSGRRRKPDGAAPHLNHIDVAALQDRAQTVVGQARSLARDQVEHRSGDIGARAIETADELRAIAEQLRAQGNDLPAWLAEEAARRATQLGEYLEGTSGEQLLRDIEALGRKRPWAVVIGGTALGVVGSRFWKASGAERTRGAGPHRRSSTSTKRGGARSVASGAAGGRRGGKARAESAAGGRGTAARASANGRSGRDGEAKARAAKAPTRPGASARSAGGAARSGAKSRAGSSSGGASSGK